MTYFLLALKILRPFRGFSVAEMRRNPRKEIAGGSTTMKKSHFSNVFRFEIKDSFESHANTYRYRQTSCRNRVAPHKSEFLTNCKPLCRAIPDRLESGPFHAATASIPPSVHTGERNVGAFPVLRVSSSTLSDESSVPEAMQSNGSLQAIMHHRSRESLLHNFVE